jgi:hypothetical protein
MEGPAVLVERKTRRGRIGSLGPNGLEWRRDAGYRFENGHVSVASIPLDSYDFSTLRDSLQAADTWRKWDRGARPTWEGVEAREAAQKAAKRRHRQEDIRYRTSELYDKYVWKYKSRISVPEKVA